MHSQKYVPFILLITITSLLIGCTTTASTVQQSGENLPPTSPVSTETFTPALTLTGTITPSFTPEPTSTETPTVTPTPTPNMVLPGTYFSGGCGSASMSQGGQLTFCVTSVTVNSNRHMLFNVTWTLSGIPSNYTVTKGSDEGNKKMYLLDSFGNRYNHIGGGDGAYSQVVVTDGVPISGWFDFGQPPVGAFVFELHDDDNGIVIGGISLYGGTSAQVISYKDFSLDQYPLKLIYQDDIWQPALLDGVTPLLADKNIQYCTIRAHPSTQPKGEYKSTTELGNVTYEIYGYFDTGINLFIREYVYVSGVAGMDPSLKPFFIVTIPADNSMACILDSSNLLSSLTPTTP